MKLLRDFWEKQGRILLLLDPAAKTPKLDRFSERARREGERRSPDGDGENRHPGSRARARCDGAFPAGQSDHETTGGRARAISSAAHRSLTLEPERVRAANIRLQPLVQAEKGYWAETDYNSSDQAKTPVDARRDNGDAISPIAASIEKGGSADERVQANSSRMVVVSNATFIQDNAITQDQQALDFISGAHELAAEPRATHRHRAEGSANADFQPR